MAATLEPQSITQRRPREVTGRAVLFCLLAFFAVVIGVNAIMVRAAVSTFGGVETESSYKAGLAFARELTAARVQETRHWQIQASIVRTAEGQRIDILARDSDQRPLAGMEPIVRLRHPTDRRADIVLTMTEQSTGRYLGLAAAPAGQWDLIIDLMRGSERMFRSKSRVVLP